MKRFAEDEQEPVVGVPLVVEPVVVEDAPRGITVQHRDVPVNAVHRGRAVLSVSRTIQITIPLLARGGIEFYSGP